MLSSDGQRSTFFTMFSVLNITAVFGAIYEVHGHDVPLFVQQNAIHEQLVNQRQRG